MSRFKVHYLGNVAQCRVEAEVVDSKCSDKSDPTCAVVYESGDVMEVEMLPRGSELAMDADFQRAVTDAKEGLLRYVNRRGNNRPSGLSAAGLSLWLLEKKDGTAMGVKIR